MTKRCEVEIMKGTTTGIMKGTTTGIVLLMLIGLIATAVYVAADPTGAEVRSLNSSRGDNVTKPAGSVFAQAGNVTLLEINASQVTKAWQGFYGNVTGNISLEDANGNKMYKWLLGTVQGEIYASRSNTLTWAAVNCSNTSRVINEEWRMGQTGADTDNITATFSISNDHPLFYVGSKPINADYDCYTTYTYVNNVSQSGPYVFAEMILDDGDATNRTVYATLLNDSATGFTGQAYDFQMLVPEDGHNESAAAALTQYYFWAELT